MIYGPAFYKLLDIPESVDEPTAYHLLGLDPAETTPAGVDQALKRRRVALRQSIPGPQFIPIVSMIEQELEGAAAILRDPRRRRQYDGNLQRDQGRRRKRSQVGRRRELVEQCRRVVRTMVDPDGCLPEGRRGDLRRRLAELGLPDSDVRYVVEHIPLPTRRPDETSTQQRRQDRDEATEFFAAAIDLEIDRGLLSAAVEHKLMAMAARFGIPPGAARAKIDERLTDLGARRSLPDEPNVAVQFKIQLLAMYPEGQASPTDRRRLLSLAATQGLSARQAGQILDDYFGESPAAPASPVTLLPAAPTPADPPEETAASPLAPRQVLPAPLTAIFRDRRFRKILPVAALSWLVAGCLIYAISTLKSSIRPSAAGPARPGASRRDEPDDLTAPRARRGASRDAVKIPPLLAGALAALPSAGEARRLFNEADPATARQSLATAAALLLADAPARQRARAESLFAALLGCPAADGPVQDAAVTAMLSRLRAAADGTQPADGARTYRLAKMLADLLFLRSTPGARAADPARMAGFLGKCEAAWAESMAARPSDPVNDPARLAEAVTAGGNLMSYARRADEVSLAAVAVRLAATAAEPTERGSQEALIALMMAGGSESGKAELTKIVRLALCNVIQQTTGAHVARRVRTTLTSVLRLDVHDPLRSAAVDTPGGRQATAAELRRAVEGTRRIAAATSSPTTGRARPVAPGPAIAGASALARKVRATWSASREPRALLTDAATTMLACADRVARFASRSDALSLELLSVLGESDPSLRAARLTQKVELADGSGGGPSAGSPVLAAEAADRLRKELRSSVAGQRYRAIEQLRALNSPQAAGLLVERLAEIVKTGPSDYATMNRTLRALTQMTAATIPAKLAELVEPARVDYAAHRVVQALLTGSGYARNPYQNQYRLPITHNPRQRKACAAAWRARAMSCSWGPAQAAALPQANGQPPEPPAWKPDDRVEKLLAVFVHHADLAGRLLKAYKVPDAAAQPAPAARPRRAPINAPVTNDQLTEAVDRLLAELTRLARQFDERKTFAVKTDMIELRTQARLLACETTLQRAAVRLDAAGSILEILVLLSPGGAERKAAIDQIRRRRSEALASADNVLSEIRECSYYNLVLLELLPAAGPQAADGSVR